MQRMSDVVPDRDIFAKQPCANSVIEKRPLIENGEPAKIVESEANRIEHGGGLKNDRVFSRLNLAWRRRFDRRPVASGVPGRCREFSASARAGPTDPAGAAPRAEVANAKSGILQASAQSRAQDGSVAAGWIANLYLGRTWAWSKQLEDKIAALTTAQVSAALRKHIDPSKVTVVKAGDFSKAK